VALSALPLDKTNVDDLLNLGTAKTRNCEFIDDQGGVLANGLCLADGS